MAGARAGTAAAAVSIPRTRRGSNCISCAPFARAQPLNRTLSSPGTRGKTAATLGESGYTLGVTVFGHTMTVLEDILVVGALGIVLLSLAAWS